ncbi:uncharacterized protein PHA67_009158 [Liasis olivaceus]
MVGLWRAVSPASGGSLAGGSALDSLLLGRGGAGGGGRGGRRRRRRPCSVFRPAAASPSLPAGLPAAGRRGAPELAERQSPGCEHRLRFLSPPVSSWSVRPYPGAGFPRRRPETQAGKGRKEDRAAAAAAAAGPSLPASRLGARAPVRRWGR